MRHRNRVLATVLVLCTGSSAQALPWRFVVSGDSRGTDTGVNSTILSEIAAATVAENPDFILFSGDLVTGSPTPATLQTQLTYWRTLMAPVYAAGIDVYPVRGNRDAGSLAAWNNVFTGPYALPANGPPGEENLTYSFAHNEAFVLGFEQLAPGQEHRVNQAWADQQLQANGRPLVLAFGHYPAFSVEHADCLDDYPAQRDAFWDSLAVAGGRVYFTGHDHFYDHAIVPAASGLPLLQLVVGTAGAPLATWSGTYADPAVTGVYHAEQYGYLLVEVDEQVANFTWKQRTAPSTYVAAEQFQLIFLPEPTGLSLVLLGGAGLLRRRKAALARRAEQANE
jgi:hypothetical protein